MSLTEHYYTRFEEGNFYYVYNRSVDRKPMFKNEGNYEFFLQRYNKYLSPVLETYAFGLLVNRFELLVRVKNLTTFKELSNLNACESEKNTHEIVSHQFRKFYQSYAMAFNKQQNRIGTLFQTPFKRAQVDKEYLAPLLYSIHANPQYLGLICDSKDWKWSSYNRILNNIPSNLKKKEVMSWFGNKENYEKFHSNMENREIFGKFILKDE